MDSGHSLLLVGEQENALLDLGGVHASSHHPPNLSTSDLRAVDSVVTVHQKVCESVFVGPQHPGTKTWSKTLVRSTPQDQIEVPSTSPVLALSSVLGLRLVPRA